MPFLFLVFGLGFGLLLLFDRNSDVYEGDIS